MRAFLHTIYRVGFDAFYHFTEDDGWAMASHVALSALLAVFPFLIFGTALATFLGADRFAETAIHIIFDTWPESISKPVSDQIVRVLTIPRGGLLTISVLAAAYFASNGVEALRVSLNRAYRVAETRPWYITRLVSLGFVLGAVVVLTVISALLVVVPVALAFAEKWFPWLKEWLATISNWRVYGTIGLLALALLIFHMSLPAGNRRLLDVIPGVVLTLVLWLIGALVFAYYLASFANYAAMYAGLASIMVVIVFLYMVAVIFIIGAEFNAALMKFNVLPSRAAVSKSEEPADLF
ncbi:YihY/virulence factor BrkB family protein [Rhizobium sp. S95]|uniref:YihY/virulence factor BrkB family protein n=1 Tax=Ciceribacter sichuanensis TaxID=2949647 RepID=A0AAJ1BWK9_9HYPH|nr:MULTISPECIES: YihY/virulence factor BrkB family protein [unclassified Ciceribacter]MCM2396223.1 YihY/virulence factor BrkB family protein [Ciceribacter sp. S95]MCM2402465.1 YihY/virulence factor BrkB family protein [Ciceribacter sp. S153]MCO5957626.1 YihY/virulence factor BrkB family protein [Ciceribacter sp. S101]